MTAKVILLASLLVSAGCVIAIFANPDGGLGLLMPFGIGLVSFVIFLITAGYMLFYRKLQTQASKSVFIAVTASLFLAILMYVVWAVLYS